MLSLKILGAIDTVAAFAFLMLIFSIQPITQFILFCAGLLFIKSLFMLGGDILSFVDLLSSIFLILAIFFSLPSIILWTAAFFLLAKGVVSFL